MQLLPLAGHLEPRRRVAAALDQARLPQTLLVSGPPGAGKQRFALWVAQMLACRQRAQEPCGRCPACLKVLGLSHPDVHWLVPIPRPKAGDPDQQVAAAGDALAAVMAERREQPLWAAPDGMAIHGVASARLLLRRAALTSVEGGPKVFIVGDAERLVPQESSPEAANALLKVIEEPPRRTWFLLTAAEPSRLLPTIRSRTVSIKLGRLPDPEVRSFLAEHLSPKPAGPALAALVEAAQGAIGRALTQNGSAAKSGEAARALLDSVRAGQGTWREQVMRQPPWQARGDFSAMLGALAALLSEETHTAARHDPPGGGGGGGDGGGGPRVKRLVEAGGKIQNAIEAAQGNVNPQLLLAVLAADLEEALCP